jgi:hypothetical protein
MLVLPKATPLEASGLRWTRPVGWTRLTKLGYYLKRRIRINYKDLICIV